MTHLCPMCQKPVAKDFHPFCSQRCKMVDLNRWLKGDYAVPDASAPQEDS